MTARSALVLVICALAATTVDAQPYRWVDEKGVVHYSDTPPKHQAPVPATRPTAAPPPAGAAVETRPRLAIRFDLPKTRYQVGGAFDARYVIEYTGPPFDGVILVTYSLDGFAAKATETIRGPVSGSPRGVRLQAFSLWDSGYRCCVPAFGKAGEYRYSVAVYDCAALKRQLGAECGGEDDLADRIATKNVAPMSTGSVSVVVR